MGLPNNRKLNHLMKSLPEGVVASSAWLNTQGVSRQLVQKYVISGWLNKLTHGSYALPGSPVSWEGVLLGLSKLDQIHLHVGGISALRRSGDVHYLELGGEEKVQVWCAKKVPTRALQISLQPSLTFHSIKLFHESEADTGLVTMKSGIRDWSLKVSTPERAILEFLNEVGDSKSDFNYASEMVEGLTLARPAMVQKLLEGCTRVKVKRLFLFLAHHHHGRNWFKRLDVEKIDIGSGKRQIVKGGRFDKRFLITVPESFVE